MIPRSNNALPFRRGRPALPVCMATPRLTHALWTSVVFACKNGAKIMDNRAEVGGGGARQRRAD